MERTEIYRDIDQLMISLTQLAASSPCLNWWLDLPGICQIVFNLEYYWLLIYLFKLSI